MPVESVRGPAAVITRYLDDLAPGLLQAPFDLFNQHSPDPEFLGFLCDDQYRDASNRCGPVDRHHAMDADQSDHLLVERGDDRQLVRLAKGLQVLAYAFLVDLVTELMDQLDNALRI